VAGTLFAIAHEIAALSSFGYFSLVPQNFAHLQPAYLHTPMEQYFIIDFDSTFTQVEALDELPVYP
jgi:hypothetical protein